MQNINVRDYSTSDLAVVVRALEGFMFEQDLEEPVLRFIMAQHKRYKDEYESRITPQSLLLPNFAQAHARPITNPATLAALGRDLDEPQADPFIAKF